MRSPPPPSVGGALAALVGKPAHCRSAIATMALAHRFPCVADYFSASVGDQWGDRAPPRTPVPPSIGTKTNVVATARHRNDGFRSGFSVGACGACCAQCADRSLMCVLRLRGRLRNAPLLAAASALCPSPFYPLALWLLRLTQFFCAAASASRLCRFR
jgi:hypothetical protein